MPPRLKSACSTLLLIATAAGLLALPGCSSPSLKSLFQPMGAPDPIAEGAEPAEVAARAASQSGWLTSFREAQQLAEQTGKPILMDFTGSDWCHWCKKLDKEVFADPQFQQWAAENVILLELDFPKYGNQPELLRQQNEQLRDRYQISSYPTLLLVDAGGSVLGKLGYVRGGPDAWIAAADRKLH